ncbi:hypothetical protein [Pseudoxanthomonas putridarboris]|uniref:Uncharacterized protein n=1 Tax=Pseudoxanthomonas putridarboris TaxID=752605 RepID=A0ABU9J3U9_9GAMM
MATWSNVRRTKRGSRWKNFTMAPRAACDSSGSGSQRKACALAFVDTRLDKHSRFDRQHVAAHGRAHREVTCH